MSMDKKAFRGMVQKVLAFVDQHKITSLDELRKNVGMRVTLNTNPEELVEITERPSNLGTLAYTLSYSLTGIGIPIEVKMNHTLGYSKVIIKTGEVVKGYSPFASDPNNNIAQEKTLLTSEFPALRRELEDLLR